MNGLAERVESIVDGHGDIDLVVGAENTGVVDGLHPYADPLFHDGLYNGDAHAVSHHRPTRYATGTWRFTHIRTEAKSHVASPLVLEGFLDDIRGDVPYAWHEHLSAKRQGDRVVLPFDVYYERRPRQAVKLSVFPAAPGRPDYASSPGHLVPNEVFNEQHRAAPLSSGYTAMLVGLA